MNCKKYLFKFSIRKLR